MCCSLWVRWNFQYFFFLYPPLYQECIGYFKGKFESNRIDLFIAFRKDFIRHWARTILICPLSLSALLCHRKVERGGENDKIKGKRERERERERERDREKRKERLNQRTWFTAWTGKKNPNRSSVHWPFPPNPFEGVIELLQRLYILMPLQIIHVRWWASETCTMMSCMPTCLEKKVSKCFE